MIGENEHYVEIVGPAQLADLERGLRRVAQSNPSQSYWLGLWLLWIARPSRGICRLLARALHALLGGALLADLCRHVIEIRCHALRRRRKSIKHFGGVLILPR